jgi:peroxiredoxin
MPKIELSQPAPDFELNDFNGKKVRLSDFKNKNHVVLIFNRGFM